METYATIRKRLTAQLEDAAQALPRDLASAIAKRDWADALRDRFDVEALVAKLDEMRRERGFVTEIHAAGDRARAAQAGRRGRPRNSARQSTPITGNKAAKAAKAASE